MIQLPLRRRIASRLEPGFGMSVSRAVVHVTPSSLEKLMCARFGGGPLSRKYATKLPSFLRTTDGWMHPNPTIGSLAFQVYPPSSLIAIMPNEKPSEYIGTRIRPEGSSSGCVRVNQPMREKYSSLACSIQRARAGSAPAQ